MVYFVKATKRGLLVASEKMPEKREVTINGVTRLFNRQAKGTLGFVACVGFTPEELDLKRGDELDFTITSNPVLDKNKKPLNNLFWAE